MGSYYTVLIVTRYSKFYWLLLRQNADLLPLIKLINFYEGKYYLQPAFMKHWHQRNLIKWGLKNGYIKKKKKYLKLLYSVNCDTVFKVILTFVKTKYWFINCVTELRGDFNKTKQVLRR